MNTERAVLKGYLADYKLKKMNLETGIAANIRAVQHFLTGANVRPLADIDVEAALVNLNEAAKQKRELIDVSEKIANIIRELD